jgi:hypothetical protein
MQTGRQVGRVAVLHPLKQGQATAFFGSMCLLSGVGDSPLLFYADHSDGQWKDFLPREVHDC